MVYRRRMPARRPPKKNPRRGLRARRPRRRVVPRGLRQAVIPFQREQVVYVNTNDMLPGLWSYGTATNYHTVRNSMIFSLNQLPDITEFFTLFKSYRLNCIVVKIASLHNSSQYTAGSAPNYYGGNIAVMAEKNLYGLPLDSAVTQDYWSQTQAKKSFVMRGNRELTFKIFPKVNNKVYLDSTHDMVVQKSPPWIPVSTDGANLPHYGLNLQFSLLDPSLQFATSVNGLTNVPPMNFRVTYKYLFQMRGVR